MERVEPEISQDEAKQDTDARPGSLSVRVETRHCKDKGAGQKLQQL